MAKVWANVSNVILKFTVTKADELIFTDIPGSATQTLEFDETTNMSLVNAMMGYTGNALSAYTLVSGEIIFGGSPVTINPPQKSYGEPSVTECRLSLEDGVAVSTSDQLAKSNLYLVPYKGNRISLYNTTTSTWTTHDFFEGAIISLSVTSGKNYDVFAYFDDEFGIPAMELSSAWTNDTTRATSLTTQDEVVVKSGDASRKYIGTIRASATNQCEDSEKKRFVWNHYNQVRRKLKVTDTTNSWTYASATFHQANASSANQVEIVVGQSPENVTEISVQCLCGNQAVTGLVGIGVNSTTTRTQDRAAGGTASAFAYANASLVHSPAIGYSYYAWIEAGDSATSKTYYGDNGVTDSYQGGMLGTHFC